MTVQAPQAARTGAVGIAGFWHETNSFSPYLTDLEAFSGATGAVLRGADEMATRYTTDCPTAGFVEAVRHAGRPLAPIVDAYAWPSGTITSSTFAELADAIVEGLLGLEEPAAFLLSLHGAAVAEGCGDPEGTIVARLRAARPRVPIGVVLDHHAGVSEELIAASDIVVGYKTEPHIDLAECGERAGRIALELARGSINRIERCFVRLPVLLPIENLLTTQGPLAGLMAHARELEERSGALDISLFPGFAYSDKPATGAAVLVQTRDDATAARALAIEIAREFWAHRGEFTRPAESADACVERALRSTELPVILVDKADHPGAGGVGDSSMLLRLLCSRAASGTVVAPLHDPESVARASEIGVGHSGQFRIGGRYTGTPFETEARVRLVADGAYEALGPVDHGALLSIGRCAVLEIGGVEAVVCEGRSGANDPELLRRLGIEPTRRRILALKALGTFRAAFESIAGEVIMVAGEGAADENLAQLQYRHLTRPIEPLDEVEFDAEGAARLVPGRVWA
jgi:microcystin degradation protein MlrC